MRKFHKSSFASCQRTTKHRSRVLVSLPFSQEASPSHKGRRCLGCEGVRSLRGAGVGTSSPLTQEHLAAAGDILCHSRHCPNRTFQASLHFPAFGTWIGEQKSVQTGMAFLSVSNTLVMCCSQACLPWHLISTVWLTPSSSRNNWLWLPGCLHAHC